MPDYVLVVVGGNTLDNAEKKIYKDLNIIFLQMLVEQQLNILYNNTFFLLYPSCYEDFGLLVVEAMKVGCPVVSVNSYSILAVARDAALLVDKPCAKKFIQAIKQLENDLFNKGINQQRIDQAKKFSWEKCATETYDFYKTIL